ncbi:MAG: hypothetical protein GY863_09875 [bacterium]|nr:hypothetical protein [bacterium]
MPWNIFVPFAAFLFGIIPYLYVGWRLTRSLTVIFPTKKKLIRLFVTAVFMFLNIMPVLFFLYSSTGNTDQLFVFEVDLQTEDYLFNFPFWAGIISIGEIIVYYLFIDIFQLLLRKFSEIRYKKWKYRLYVLRAVLFGVVITYVSIRSYIDTNSVRIDEYAMSFDGLPDNLKDLEMVFVSDLHYDRYTKGEKIEEFNRKMAETDPDLFLFSGDMVSRGNHFIDSAIETLNIENKELRQIACIGDHDFWTGINKTLAPLEEKGWEILDNEHLLIEHNGSTILITGITYIYSRKISKGALKRLLSNAPEADFRILLVHQPADSVVDTASEYGYDLLLAGHTHGGQIVFRSLGFKETPAKYENRLFSGFYDVNGMYAIVTNGIGLTATSIRYHAPAEIVKITLK